MSELAKNRVVVLIGGTRHGEEIILNENGHVAVVHNIAIAHSHGNQEIYTLCQLKSGQWIGYIEKIEETDK